MDKTLTEQKWLYCNECKTYPDKVIADMVNTEERKWNGECYELIETCNYDNDNVTYYCEKCFEKLIEK